MPRRRPPTVRPWTPEDSDTTIPRNLVRRLRANDMVPSDDETEGYEEKKDSDGDDDTQTHYQNQADNESSGYESDDDERHRVFSLFERARRPDTKDKKLKAETFHMK